MDSAKRKYRGLQARTVRAVMLICGLLGLVLLCIGLSMYSMSLIRQYTDHAGCVSELASQSVRRGVDGVGFSRKVMEIYWNLSDEDRARNGTPEYQDLFAGVKETHEYRLLKNMLASFARPAMFRMFIWECSMEQTALLYISLIRLRKIISNRASGKTSSRGKLKSS